MPQNFNPTADFNPTTYAASTAGLGGGSGSGSASTPGVGGVPGVSATPSSSGSGSMMPNGSVGSASAVTPVGVSANPAMTGAGSSGWDKPVTSVTATPNAIGWTDGGAASTDPTIVANREAKRLAQQGPAIYGANGNQTLGQFQQWQADEFNKNQLAGLAAFNQARSQMPYNTTGNLANPYDQYVSSPATPGVASPATQNAGLWNNSGLAAGNTFASGGNQDYQRNQLSFLLRALQNYGPGGQNRFGNGFSPVFTGGQATGSPLNGLGNSTANPGGYQSNSGSGSSFSLAQLLPLLLGLAQQPQNGAYGNLG